MTTDPRHTDPQFARHFNYTDESGQTFRLVPGPAYAPNQHACHGCAFRYGNSPECRSAPTCTPHEAGDVRRPRLTPAGFLWVRVN